MVRNPIDIWFDFVDPTSVLLMLEIEAARRENVSWMHTSTIKWRALEVRAPPIPMVSLEDPEVASCWESALPLAEKIGVVLNPPRLVPWTRKAHELVVHAEKTRPQSASALRLSVAIAYAIEGQDIGRVDLLVKIASDHGLDRTECKAVLDVDKYETVVTASAKEAKAAYVTYVPTIAWGAKRLEGFHNRTALGTLLGT
ncbi:DsbA family protein [Gemmatimonadales bacterium]|nr:DsbA family protein [Gemmatimonadales bacterium]